MSLSVAPVFPIWLIVVLVVIALGLRVAALIRSARRRGQAPDRHSWWQFGAAVLAIACLGMAATRVGDESKAEQPSRQTTTAEETNINVFLVIDRSVQMEAQDFDDGAEERLTAVRQDLEVIAMKYDKARFEVISYADEARVEWPLSPDVWSLVPFLWGFTPYGGDYGDERQRETDVTASDDLLKDQLNKAVHDYPGSANLVYLLGSGSDGGGAEFDIPPGQVSGGAVFGYGTTEGAEVYDNGDFVDYELNEQALQAAADSLGVPFEQRDRGSLPEDTLASTPPQATPVDPIVPDVPHPNRIEFYWLFAAIALGLFGFELYHLGRHWLRRRVGGTQK